MREKQQKRHTKRICRSLWLLVELNSLRPSNSTLESELKNVFALSLSASLRQFCSEQIFVLKN